MCSLLLGFGHTQSIIGIVQKVFSEKASAIARMRQKCVRMGLVLLGKEEGSKMRQKCIKLASKTRGTPLGENTFWTIPSITHLHFSISAEFQKNPHAHKNKIGTSTPPFQKIHDPPLKRGISWTRGFSSRKKKTKKCQAPIKLAQPFSAPELRAEKLRTVSRGFF